MVVKSSSGALALLYVVVGELASLRLRLISEREWEMCVIGGGAHISPSQFRQISGCEE